MATRNESRRPAHSQHPAPCCEGIRLARLLAAGELSLVTIPSVEREQLRDLVRCGEDIRADLMRARNRIGKFLLRPEIYYEGPGETWSRKHRSSLTSVRFADHASRATLADYLHAHDVLIARSDQVEADLAQLALSVSCAHTVARLRCLRGIDTLSALGLCAEIVAWERFDHPVRERPRGPYCHCVPRRLLRGRKRQRRGRRSGSHLSAAGSWKQNLFAAAMSAAGHAPRDSSGLRLGRATGSSSLIAVRQAAGSAASTRPPRLSESECSWAQGYAPRRLRSAIYLGSNPRPA